MIPAGLYVYAIVRSNHPCVLSFATGVGDIQGTPWRIDAEPLAAVVSRAGPDLRAKRRDLTIHHNVLTELMSQGPVLPMRFGVVVPDAADIRADLTTRTLYYQELLSELEGRVEVNVKLLPDEEHMLREVAVSEPAVLRAREHGAASFEERLELGRAVAAALTERQNADARTVIDTLTPMSVRQAEGPMVAGCALNVGFLVEADQTEPFVAAAKILDRTLGARVEVQCTGPLPPYSFVGTPGG